MVFPEPGGPHKIKEKLEFFSISCRRGQPSPTTCSCPRNSSQLVGRMRLASGEGWLFSVAPSYSGNNSIDSSPYFRSTKGNYKVPGRVPGNSFDRIFGKYSGRMLNANDYPRRLRIPKFWCGILIVPNLLQERLWFDFFCQWPLWISPDSE